ncbi:hypothetical protein F2Q69_00003268 [Brassica cretica]|uniref:Uncharacterized protein n=1 Tax=Brassica cretica TaxID=69181 RepID=A0A8S9PAD2_BRACR|nr:hypothetical protein F2Q69_00003268 [Brassica cretica]
MMKAMRQSLSKTLQYTDKSRTIGGAVCCTQQEIYTAGRAVKSLETEAFEGHGTKT